MTYNQIEQPTDEYMDVFIEQNNLSEIIDRLNARGIELNTWQIHELVGEGDSRIGKTTLAYALLAEESTGDIIIARTEDFSKFKDVGISLLSTSQSRYTYLRAFQYFLEEYYADRYIVVLADTALIAKRLT